MKLTRNFSLEEFCRSDKAEALGIDNAPDRDAIEALAALCKALLQPLRNTLGVSLNISSGYRSEALNAAVGGEDNSQHRRGEAADVYCKTQFRPVDIARSVLSLRLDYDQMILYPTFVHLSYTLRRKNRRQLLYNRRYKGERLDLQE